MSNNGCNIGEKKIRNKFIDYNMWLVIGGRCLIEYSDIYNSGMNEISRIIEPT